MAKIDKAIEFLNNNYTMINSIRGDDEDKDVVAYILRQLNIRKKEIEKEKNNGK